MKVEIYWQEAGAIDENNEPMDEGWYLVGMRESMCTTSLVPFGSSYGPFETEDEAKRCQLFITHILAKQKNMAWIQEEVRRSNLQEVNHD